MIKIERMVLGSIGTNCYLAFNLLTNEGFVVDPADNAPRIAARFEELHMAMRAILLTHGHYDHIGAVDELKEKEGGTVYVSEKDSGMLSDTRANLSELFMHPLRAHFDKTVSDGQVLHIAGYEIAMIATPGHTEGSCCWYIAKEHVLFSGDTLFEESVGRTDFPTGSSTSLLSSLREKLMILPDDTDVLPGHGETTTIGWEKEHNPYK